MTRRINVFLNNKLYYANSNHTFLVQKPFPLTFVESSDYKNIRIVIKSGKRFTIHFDGHISIW